MKIGIFNILNLQMILLMFTITNATILKGENLEAKKENILVDDGKIIEINDKVKEGTVIDCNGSIVLPSFLNGHTHIGDSIIKDEGYGLSLDEMVKPPNGVKHVALSNASDKDLIEAMKESMWDMLNSGTNYFIDYREGGVKGVKLLKKASKDIPIKPIILGRDESFYTDDLDEVERSIKKLLKIADGIAPSGFGEISQEVANLITEKCRDEGKISSIHVAESIEAQEKSLNASGKTEVNRAIDCSFKQIVHGTNLKQDDLKLISKSNVNLCLCPRANATLAVGVPPLSQLEKLNINPILGSDNLMLNSPDMFRELEFTCKLCSVSQKYNLSPRNLVKMATTNITFNSMNKQIQKPLINEGESADFIIVRQKSKNPYLSIINRTNSKDILYTINKDSIHKY